MSHSHTRGLHLVAILEAVKGVIVLIAGFGLLTFLGQDVEAAAERLIQRLHLNPAHHYPQVFIEAMAAVTNTRLWVMAGFAGLYSSIRLIEAYGLWQERSWAKWFAALSGSIYIPIELYELARHATWLKFGALVINVMVVAYMASLLREAKQEKAQAVASTMAD